MARKFSMLMLLGAVLMAVTACSSINPATKINSILMNPRDYSDRQVTVSGTVEDTFSIVLVKYFVVRDDTGAIPVISRKAMPLKGNVVQVTGTVQEAFSLGDQSLVVLMEK